eukprot:11306052-Alexandrium_andersonii.AAC.1
MQKRLRLPQVGAAVGHMCRFGMRVSEPACAGVGGPLVRRPSCEASQLNVPVKDELYRNRLLVALAKGRAVAYLEAERRSMREHTVCAAEAAEASRG